MADDMPTGWTEARYANATDADYEGLTEEQLQKVMDRSLVEHRAKMRVMYAQKNEERAAQGLRPLPLPWDSPPSPPPQPPQQQQQDPEQSAEDVVVDTDPTAQTLQRLVETVEDARLERFGFMVFRAYYGDETLWEEFNKRFFELIDVGIEAAPEGSGVAAIADKAIMKVLSDGENAECGWRGCGEFFGAVSDYD